MTAEHGAVPSPHNLASNIDRLTQYVSSLEQRLPLLPHPYCSAMVEAVEELSGALEEMRAANERLVASHQVTASEWQRYRELFDFAPDGYLVTDIDGVIQEANRAASTLLKVSQRHLVGKPIVKFIAADSRPAFLPHLARLQRGEELRECEVRLQPRSEPFLPVAFSAVPARDVQEQVIGLRWLVRDVSERQRREEALSRSDDALEQRVQERTMELARANAALRAALHEKELLLKEVHHRIKNNLQVVSSLLDLQADASDDPRIRTLLEDSQHRIHAIALIHETLYQSGEAGRVELSSLIRLLAERLLSAYVSAAKAVRLQVDAEEVWLDLQRGVPCGLILNELLSNCLKHAFPSGHAGLIHVRLHREATQHVYLNICDNGVGFPAGVDFRHVNSLGLQLVCMLTEQLGGEIELERHNGTAFTLSFPL